MIFRQLIRTFGVNTGRLINIKIMTQKPNVVFVLGGPGAGKGTQCEKIVEKFGYVHLSAGDLLRAERKQPESQFGQLIDKHIVEGSIVPVEITCSLLEKAMVQNQANDKNNFLIDGFPRNKDNLDGWEKQMGEKANVIFVLFFDCTEEVCVNRCLSRGASGSGRADDNKASLQKRLVTYNESTKPIIDHYDAKQLVRRIVADGTVDEVFHEVIKVFMELQRK